MRNILKNNETKEVELLIQFNEKLDPIDVEDYYAITNR